MTPGNKIIRGNKNKIKVSAFPSIDHLTKKEKKQLINYKKIPKNDILNRVGGVPNLYWRKMCFLAEFLTEFIEERFKRWDALIFIDFNKIVKFRGDIYQVEEILTTISRITEGTICYMDYSLFDRMLIIYDRAKHGHEMIRKERDY